MKLRKFVLTNTVIGNRHLSGRKSEQFNEDGLSWRIMPIVTIFYK